MGSRHAYWRMYPFARVTDWSSMRPIRHLHACAYDLEEVT